MNYFTNALQLPSWATEAQRYSTKAIRYTPLMVRAFNQTIAPVIATTAKDLSRYYIQCLKGAHRWALQAAGITHNPITAAVRAAAAELSSAEARVTYSRIGHILHERLVDGLIVAHYGIAAMVIGYTAAQSAYRAGAKLYRAVYNRINPSEPLPTVLPSVDMAIAAVELDQALHLAANIAEVETTAQAGAVVEEPAPEAEQSVQGCTPIVGPISNPTPKDMHEKVARLLELQPDLALAPVPVVEEPSPEVEAKAGRKKAPSRRGKAKGEVGQVLKGRVTKERSRSKLTVE